MKKIVLCLLVILSTLSFSGETKTGKMDYVIKVEKVEYEEADYKAYVEYEQMLSDDGTLGLNVVRVCRALKMLQEKYPKGKWFYVDSVDKDNKMVITASMKSQKVNLRNKNSNVEICKEVLDNGSIFLIPEARAKLNKFIKNGHIPMM